MRQYGSSSVGAKKKVKFHNDGDSLMNALQLCLKLKQSELPKKKKEVKAAGHFKQQALKNDLSIN